MKHNRIDRINSLLKEVIVEVIQEDVRNPHVYSFVSVTRVETSKDLHHAKVYVSIIGTPAQKTEILAGLQSAAGFIAVNASKKVELRYFPELVFKLDTALDEQIKIHEMLAKIEQERQSREPT